MSENEQNRGKPEFVGGIPVRTEEIGYRADEMLACPKCGKANPPTREGCLYCGTAIAGAPITPGSTSLDVRQLEEWEIGGNVIMLSGDGASESAISSAAKLLQIEPQIVAEFANRRSPLPIARLEPAAADRIAAELGKLGFQCRVVSDKELQLSESPIRVRELNFDGTAFETLNFNTRERLSFPMSDVEALISGRIITASKATTEKKQRKDSKIIDETEMSSDETVLDIYVKGHFAGFRVQMNGFDFSCLGSDKKLLAAENMSTLRAKISAAAVNASVIDDFEDMGELLGVAWPVETRTDSLGLHRSGIGRKDFKKVATVSNLRQFNRYSRLRRVLL